MPSRNILKEHASESFYHVYARGINKLPLFLCDNDFSHFISLFERYLSDDEMINKNGGLYPSFIGQIEILAYCLKSNHFHILLYQLDVPYLEKFMRSVMTSYSRYFNLKYKRTGPVFESRYKAVRIDNNDYLQHISRYIHLNPANWRTYKYSSCRYYLNGGAPDWLNPRIILEQFGSTNKYEEFVADYEEMHDTLGALKDQLADS